MRTAHRRDPLMWWKAEAQDLPRVSERSSTLYIEHSHIDRAENAVIIVNKQRTVRFPATSIAAVLIGPGCRLTQAAAALLGDSGTAVCWVGEHGVRMYGSAVSQARGNALLLRQATLVSNQRSRLDVARRMYGMRFPGEDLSGATMQALRGREGARMRSLYRRFADEYRIEWSGREYVAGDAFAAGDAVNRLLSASHSSLYGVCHAAITAIGASPGLGFVHTGNAVSFVLDIADLYKAETSIPLAFELAADGRHEERDARLGMRDIIHKRNLLSNIVDDIIGLLDRDRDIANDVDAGALWGERDEIVQSGVNYGDRYALDHAIVSGPHVETTTWH